MCFKGLFYFGWFVTPDFDLHVPAGFFDLHAVFNLDYGTERSARLEDEPFLKGGRMLRPCSLVDMTVL